MKLNAIYAVLPPITSGRDLLIGAGPGSPPPPPPPAAPPAQSSVNDGQSDIWSTFWQEFCPENERLVNFKEYDEKKVQERIAVDKYMDTLEREAFFTPNGAFV